ncbi:MAG TPA: hypothetical protein VHY32_06090 [Caulobacteraceae bacterium]|jgi:hypothetical protein|nr:hypothetical protein [Caulobacteraceae bacterium]
MLKNLAMPAAGLAAIFVTGGPAPALAAEDPIVLHLIGDAPAADEDGPRHFVLNATVNHDDGSNEDVVTGRLVLLPPLSASSDVKGACVKKRCDFTADLDGATINFSGDLSDHGGLAAGKFDIPGVEGDRKEISGAVIFTTFTNSVPGLGDLVKPGAIDSRTLDDLLMWAGTGHGFIGSDDAHPIDDDEQEDLATWQLQNQRPATGLLFASELALMTRQRADAQKAVGWSVLGGPALGWSAGYPAKLLPTASRDGAEQRFVSVDGKASLIVAIDPPLENEEFNARMEKLINEDVPGQTDRNYGLAGDNMQISYVQGGNRVSIYYYRREGGVARLVLTYPAPAASTPPGQNPLDDIASTITGSFRVADAIKPGP